MAGLTIGKLGFGKDDFQYGLELCLSKAGREAYPVTTATAIGCDVLLVTAFWYRDFYHLLDFRRKAGLEKGKAPLVIVGGIQATLAPEAFSALADYVFLGDADDHMGGILDQIEAGTLPVHPALWDGIGEPPAPAICAPSAFAMRKGGARDVVRIEIARGCRFKCAFCALSGLKAYREVSAADVVGVLPQKGIVSCFAPDRMGHSEWREIHAAIHSRGLHDLGSDVRLENLAEWDNRAAITGIEGMSFRLRKLAGKGWTDAQLLDMIGAWVERQQGVCTLGCYFVGDLPGEAEEDFAECFRFFEALESQTWAHRLNLRIAMNPLSPKRFTKLADAKIHPLRPYGEKWREIERRRGGQWKFRVKESMVWTPWDRVKDVLVQRAGTKAAEIAGKLAPKWLLGKPPAADSSRMATELLDLANRCGVSDEQLNVARAHHLDPTA